MDGWIFLLICVAAGAILWIGSAWSERKANRLDSELTAYVAEGSMTPGIAKAILDTEASTDRKREVAALIAEGMEPEKGIALLQSMAAA